MFCICDYLLVTFAAVLQVSNPGESIVYKEVLKNWLTGEGPYQVTKGAPVVHRPLRMEY